jgi:hypothetical protein
MLQLGDHSIYVRDTEWTFLLLCSRLPFAGPDFIKAYLIDQFEFLAANAQKVVRPEQVAEAKAILAEAVLTAQKSDYQDAQSRLSGSGSLSGNQTAIPATFAGPGYSQRPEMSG